MKITRNISRLAGLVVAAVMALGVILAPVEAKAVGTVTEGKQSVGMYVVTSTKSKTLAQIGLTPTAKNADKVIIGACMRATGANSGLYYVTTIKANSYKGAKAKKVVLPPSVTKIERKAFNGQKAAKILIKIKSTKLTSASVKGMLKGAKAKSVTLRLPKSKRASYKRVFTKGNLGYNRSLTLEWYDDSE